MTPQLVYYKILLKNNFFFLKFINYKLKSVAHLPWRTFAYKALNTFIDDLFAFIIKMVFFFFKNLI